MGCLRKIISFCFSKVNRVNNRVYPIDNDIHILDDDSHDINNNFGVDNRTISNYRPRGTRRARGTRRTQSSTRYRTNNIPRTNNRPTEENDIYDGMSTNEIISLIDAMNPSLNQVNSLNDNVEESNKKKKKKLNRKCPICLEKMNNEEPNLRIICKNKQCKACYHKNCINEWAKTKGTNDIACLLCTLKTIKVNANQRSNLRRNEQYSNVGYYNQHGQYYNNDSRYNINYGIYNYRAPNTR
tara:strand:+ start:76 stop:798 length:723 start_codon:yes stop_codon:yes gene_type:complete